MRTAMDRPLCLACLVFVISPARPQEHELVWAWSQQCKTPTTTRLEVRLDDAGIYSTSIPLCRRERASETEKASFQFIPTRPLVWYGYRSDEEDGTPDLGDTTAAGTKLDVDLWQAGGEQEAIELGYTVTAADGIHMNSVHVLSVIHRVSTTMAPGLVLETWPEH